MPVAHVMRIWAAIILSALPAFAVQLTVRNYTTSDGLPRNSAFCLTQDSSGYLWLCTTDGLARFDGKAFDLFGTAQGLPNRVTNEFLETREGLKLVATDGGVARLDTMTPPGAVHQFVPLATTDGRTVRRADELFQDAEGTVWAGTLGGVYRVENLGGNPKLAFVPVGTPTLSVQSFANDGAGGIWIGTNAGLFRRWRNGKVEQWRVGGEFALSEEVNSLLFDAQGRLWIGTYRGLWMLSQPARVFGPVDGLASERIHSLFQSADGTIWVGTALGLGECRNSSGPRPRFTSYGRSEGLRGRVVFAITETKDGSLWAAMDHGLARISRSGFLRYSASDGMGELAIASFVRDHAGHLYAVSNETNRGPGLHLLEGMPFKTIRPAYPGSLHGSGWGLQQTVLVDRGGEWWFATSEGLVRFPAVRNADDLSNTRPSAFYTVKDGLKSNAVLRLFEDSAGRIWVSTIGGLSLWTREENRFQQIGEGEIPGYVSAFAEDHGGDIWIASSVEAGTGQSGALFRFHNNRLERIPGTAADTWIASLFVDSAGRLWVGSNDSGLTRVDHPSATSVSFRRYNVADGLSSFAVSAISEDQFGRIYAATPRGLDQLDPATNGIQHFSLVDGLLASLISAIGRDSYGRLWFGTALGLVSFQPRAGRDAVSVPVVIKTVLVNGKARSGRRAFVLKPNENQLQIQFAAPTATDSEWLHFQYRMNGAEGEWSAPSEDRTVNYSNLPAGHYHFEVRSVLGQQAPGPATEIEFDIAPHFWQRWWFIMLVAGAIAALALLWHRRDLQRRLEVERVRARIAADLHDDLGASLTRVVILSEVAQRQSLSRNDTGINPDAEADVNKRLSEIADTARGLADGMSDLVWSIDPLRDDVPSLLNRVREFASDVLEPQGIAWSLEAAEEVQHMRLAADLRWQLFLILKEAINNAARHARCTRLEIHFGVSDGYASVSVVDNGCGLADDIDGTSGNGLGNMQRRAAALTGSLQVLSKPGAGVTVELRFPLASDLRPGKLARRA